MACLGVQIGSSAGRRVSVSGAISEDIHCRFRHSLLEFTDERQKRCRRVAMCLAQLGKSESYGASVVTSLPLALSEVKSPNGRKKPANPPQVDNLIKRSVTEIVKNPTIVMQRNNQSTAVNSNWRSKEQQPRAGLSSGKDGKERTQHHQMASFLLKN